jgi:hypothetical protein
MRAAARLRAEHLRALRAALPIYCRHALKIQTKGGLLTELDENLPQRLLAARVEAQRRRTGRVRVVVLKARQEGISTWCAARIFHGTTLWSNRRGLVLADKLERAGEIFSIYERFDRHLPLALRPPKRASRRARELAWTTDSRLTVETAADADAGRGTTIHFLHASELAMWPRAEETWTALMQAVPSDSGEVYVESTAKGIGNLFHRMWVAAESGTSEWCAVFLPWWIHAEYAQEVSRAERRAIETSTDPFEREVLDDGIAWEGVRHRLRPEQLAWRRAKIRDDFLGDERAFRQEFPATAREAFLTTGDGFFATEALERLEAHAVEPVARGTFVALSDGFALQPGERGYVRIWEKPKPDGHYVIGADTAEGKMVAATSPRRRSSRSAKSILRPSCESRCLRVVAEIHGRMVPEVFAEQVYAASAFWSCPGPESRPGIRDLAMIGVERNHSSGQTVLRSLREHYRHPRLFRHRRMNVFGRPFTVELGWVTDGTSRMPMLDHLAALIRNGQIDVGSRATIGEMFTFVRGEDGRPAAQEGAHDDRVLALAIAAQMVLHHTDPPTGELPEVVVYDTPTGL